jgi:hypothetical protein
VTLLKGRQFCNGNAVTYYEQWFLEHKCELGTVIYRNKISGLEVVSDQILVKKAKAAQIPR